MPPLARGVLNPVCVFDNLPRFKRPLLNIDLAFNELVCQIVNAPLLFVDEQVTQTSRFFRADNRPFGPR